MFTQLHPSPNFTQLLHLICVIGTNVASPTDGDGILDCPEQIQLTEIAGHWCSKAEPRSLTVFVFVCG